MKNTGTSGTGAVRTKVSSFQNVTFLLQYKCFKINVIYDNNFYFKNVTEYHALRLKRIESFNAIGRVVSSTQ